MKRGKWRIAAIVLAASVVAASLGGVALAQTSQLRSAARDTLNQEFLSALASNLNVSQSTLTAAVKAAAQQVVSEEVYHGKLTQTQAESIESQPNFGKLWLPFFGGPRFHRGPGPNLPKIAAVLGLNSKQLFTDLRSGKTLEQSLADQGITLTQFKENLAAVVSSGKLTQDQANRILDQLNHTFGGHRGPPPGGPPPQQPSGSPPTSQQ